MAPYQDQAIGPPDDPLARTKTRYVIVGVVAVILVVIIVGGLSILQSHQATGPSTNVAPEAASAVELTPKQVFEREARARLARLTTTLGVVESRAPQSASAATLAALDKQRHQISQHIDALAASQGETWTEMRPVINQQLDDLALSIANIQQQALGH